MMTKFDDILELLNTLTLSTIDGKVKINKDTLCDIQSCLHNAQENIEFSQLESQFQQEELKQRNHHSEHVSVHNIETVTHQKQVNNVTVGSDLVPNKVEVVHADAEIQSEIII